MAEEVLTRFLEGMKELGIPPKQALLMAQEKLEEEQEP